MFKAHWRLWMMVGAGWLLIGLTYTLNYFFFSGHYVAIFKQPPTIMEMLVWELPYWLLWAALAPAIFWLTGRIRIDRDRWFRNSLIHIAACLGLSLLHRAIYLPLGWLLNVVAYQKLSSIADLYRSDILFNLPTGFMSYGTIFLVSYVINYYQEYQDEELKISRLRAELAQAQLRMAQAQLQALKMQLQPHFLFNTLNSISSLLDEDVDAADEMIARLGDFLRLTLENSGAQELTLHEELEFLRCYLQIEKVRFQDRLTVSFDVEPGTLEALVPNLVLQPIVENAIRHGIAATITPGQIVIRAERLGELLRLQVSDNGPGLGPERSIRPPDQRPEHGLQPGQSLGQGSGQGFGLGFSMTRARLDQMYGSRYRFDLGSASAGGLQVTLEIPFAVGPATAARQEVQALP